MVGPLGRNGGRYQQSDDGGYRRRRPRRQANNGCLYYVLLFLAAMLILAILFGGFKKGHKFNGEGPSSTSFGVPTAPAYPEPAARTAWI
jgi:hypothetical protein